MRIHSYGPSADQVGDLYMPEAGRARAAGTARKIPVICLLHGGFWRLPWGRDNIAEVARDLARRGFAVWSLEYRRVGSPGGGWPGTLDDVAAGVDHLAVLGAALTDAATSLDLARVIVVGHSAGGHLALWCAGRRDGRVRVGAVVGLAPVADLHLAHTLDCGRGAVQNFLGGTPREVPDRYASASPMQRLPLGVRQVLLHGTEDDVVPVQISRHYAAAAAAAGDAVDLIELAGVGHMDFVDPGSAAHGRLCASLDAICPGA